MSAEPYELGLTRPARRAISEVLPEDVAAAAVEFITGPLLEAPYRVGKPLRDKLAGFHSARLGTQWRILYRIDESKRVVVVQDRDVASAGDSRPTTGNSVFAGLPVLALCRACPASWRW